MLDYANPAVNANIARQYGWDGTGVGIALIDSGLQGRPDLNPTTTGQGAGSSITPVFFHDVALLRIYQ